MSAEPARHPSADVSAPTGIRARPRPPLASPRLRLPSGNQSRLRALAPASAQPKLAVSEPGDPFEREADRVADEVVATAQRSCEGGCEGDERGAACAECAQRKAEGAPSATFATIPTASQFSQGSGGQPMRASLRSFMERRIGHSFATVRLHTDARAARLARSLEARAFTIGSDVYFGQGRYEPDSARGRRLLAHELTHVVQQGEAGAVAPEAQRMVFRQSEPDTAADEGAAGEGESEEASAEAGAEESDDDPEFDVMDGDTALGPSTPPESEAPEEEAASESETPSEDVEGVTDEGDSEPIEMKGPGDKGKGKGKGKGKDKDTPKPKPKPKPKPIITKIDVDLAKQKLTITSNDGSLDGDVTISSGHGCPNTGDDPCKTGDELYCTPNVKDVAPGRLEGADFTNKDGDGMGWYVDVVPDRGIGIHNTQTANGTPLSHGCVRVGKGDTGQAIAKKINTHVNKDTKITITGKAPTKAWKRAKDKMKSYKGCPDPPEPKPKPKPAAPKKKK